MPLTTCSGSRQAPPNNKSSLSWAMKPTRISTQSKSISSKKEILLQPKNNLVEVESDSKDDLRPHLEESQNLSNADNNLDNSTARLEAQFANSPFNPMTKMDLDEEVQDNDVLSTIENYKGQVKEWPRKMLAMMGNITPYTLDKILGELGGTRVPDAYRLWLKFSVEAQKLKIPRRAKAGEVLGGRNPMLANQRSVFDPWVCYTLSGLLAPTSDVNSDDAKNGTLNLSPEDSSKYNQLSLKCIEKLHTQIQNVVNHMDFGYCFLASSTNDATAGDSVDPGWCKEFTSNEEFADYARSKANFPAIFAAQTQGMLVDKVIDSTNGKAEKMQMKGKRVDPGDKVEGGLQHCKVLKFVPPGFPCGPNPEKLKIPEGQDDMMAGNQEEQLKKDEPLGREDELGDWNGIVEDESDEVQ
ncbi:hypothetical protein DFH28DRAFT_1089888 [Melampsora americana]|nr:hypothetical protein DFH28DRAFT_1089888 [Melampsora americana]